MSKGKFEAGRSAAGAGRGEPRKRPDLLLILVPVLVLAVAAAILALTIRREQEQATGPEGLTREETLEAYRRVAELLETGDMVLTLIPDDPDFPEEPIVLTLSPAQSRVAVDLKGLEADLDDGVGKVRRGRYLPDPAAYISLDQAALRALAEQTAETWNQEYVASFAERTERAEGDRIAHDLTFNIGRRGREIRAEVIYQTLLAAYLEGDLHPTLTFRAREPVHLDAGTLWDEICTPPVDAVLDEKTYEITPEQPGSGFSMEELERLLAEAEPGRGYVLPLQVLEPAVTVADIEAVLYENILAEAHTPHSWIDDRTHNLELACAAIDGTVVMPGKVFSFNETVGERTEEKGYRPAGAYVGGSTVLEIGGGVCQVASSIYYAMLQADLKAVERHAHTYLVTYVPQGMDAAIYWGRLDFKFENISPYPIKIEASVSDGDVHILLRGMEWKDYTVKLSSKVLEEIPWETVERVITDGSYDNGKTIVSPYTGYRIDTYKSLYDLEGNFIEKVKVAYSTYRKRDKVVAVVKSSDD